MPPALGGQPVPTGGPVLEPTLPDDPEPPRPSASRGPDLSFWGEDRRPSHARRPRRPVPDGPLDRIRDLLSAWRADARIGLVALAVAAVVAGVVWYQVGVGGADDAPARRSVATSAPPSAAPAAGPTRGDAPAGAPGPSAEDVVVVHVAGAVVHPGVVELDGGARVIDAVEAAGGALATADLDRLNLAAPLADGQRVLVQNVGDPPAPADPGGTTGGSSGGTGSGSPAGLVDLNAATAEQLEELPGIGPVLAEAILAERERRGGFRDVVELRDVRGIGDQRFADIVDLVTV